MARIVTVYSAERRALKLRDMSYIRWFKISEALARLGHEVDMATAEIGLGARGPGSGLGSGLRKVPLRRVDWGGYDVVKTLFHQGFETLERYGGTDHQFIVSKLGSVVGPRDMEGIYFYGRRRRRLYRTQERIDATSRFVTVLTEPARELWESCFGARGRTLLVPGAADARLPDPGPDPYPDTGLVRCLFAGNVYTRRSQPEANRVLIDKLNELGRRLEAHGARPYLLGPGHVRRLDPRYVTYLGSVGYDASWDYLRHAEVGLLVSAGPFMHNNESTKTYHYLRVGLPVVSEAGFPNENVLTDSGLGEVVPAGDMGAMAGRIVSVAGRAWDRDRASRFILEHHTWDRRAAVYQGLFESEGLV